MTYDPEIIWEETGTGSWITLDGDEHIGTVFDKDNQHRWGGVWNGPNGALFLAETHITADGAKRAFERGVVEGSGSDLWSHPRPKRDQGWAPSKKGGLYRYGRWPREKFAIATVKQAKSGSWYGTRDGEMIDGWFDSAREAMRCIDSRACVPRQD